MLLHFPNLSVLLLDRHFELFDIFLKGLDFIILEFQFTAEDVDFLVLLDNGVV